MIPDVCAAWSSTGASLATVRLSAAPPRAASVGAEGALPETALSPRGWRRRRCSHSQLSLAHHPCADARARCVPSSISHHRNGLLEISRAVDTPAAWDHPAEHGDLHLVCLILGSTISAPC